MRQLSVTDLFSGCGGFSLGFSGSRSFQVKHAIDSWDKALDTIRLNKPAVNAIHGDLSDPEVVEKVVKEIAGTDILIGGPPCQGFSTLGKRRDGDRRSSLVDVFVEIVDAVRPKVAIVENVRGISSKKHPRGGTYADALVNGLRGCSEPNYYVTSRILNAADYGIPQNRVRWFMVAVRSDLLSEPNIVEKYWHHVERRKSSRTPTVRDGIGNLPSLNSGETKTVDSSGNPLYNHRAMKHSQALVARLKAVPPLGGLPDVPRKLLTPHLRKMLDGHYGSGGHVKNIYGRMDWSAPSGTIVAGIDKITCGRFVHPEQDRLLSPRECARLQSFPDDYRFLGGQVAQYYQIGNAVPPKLSGVLAQALRSFLERDCLDLTEGTREAA